MAVRARRSRASWIPAYAGMTNYLRQVAGDAEARETRIIIVRGVRRRAAARRRANENRHIVPGAAAQHMTGAIGFNPGAAVGGRADIGIVPAIRRPLPGIAQHAVKPETVGREGIHWRQHMIVPFAAAAVAVGVGLADILAPPACAIGAGAGGIFPFRFTGQAIRPPEEPKTRLANRGWAAFTWALSQAM